MCYQHSCKRFRADEWERQVNEGGNVEEKCSEIEITLLGDVCTEVSENMDYILLNELWE